MKTKNLPIILLATVVIGSMFADKIIEFYIDVQWFEVYKIESVFWTIFLAQFGLGLLFGGLFFGLTYGVLISIFRKTQHLPILLGEDIRREIPFLELIAHNLKSLIFSIPVLLSLFVSLMVGQQWDVILKFFNRVPFNQFDPIFGKDLSCYLFELPFITLIKDIAWQALGVIIIGSGIIYFLKRSIYLGAKGVAMLPEARRTFSLLAGLAFALLALNFYLGQFELLTEGNGVVAGIG